MWIEIEAETVPTGRDMYGKTSKSKVQKFRTLRTYRMGATSSFWTIIGRSAVHSPEQFDAKKVRGALFHRAFPKFPKFSFR
jgi:hypothetical protein